MFRFFRRERPRQIFPMIALLTGLSSGVGRAQVIDDAADATFAGTTVNLGAHEARPVSLAEIFSLVESETGLKFTYAAGQFSLGAEVVLENGGAISLARLFAIVSAQNDLVFEHRGGEIAVRTKRREEPAKRRDEFAAVAERASPAPGGSALTAEISAIMDNAKLSRAKKEKQISAAVRSAVTAATADKQNRADILAVATELADAAGNAGPQFAETIANAAAFAPPVVGIKNGPAQVRAAAYAGSRTPKKRSVSVSRVSPPQSRPGVIKAPAGRNPDTFLPAASMSSGAEPAVPEAEAPPREAMTPNVPSEPAVSGGDSTATPAPGEVSPSFAAILAPPIEVPVASPAAAQPNADGAIRMDKFGVEGTVTRGSSADLRAERVKASVAIDFLSANQLAKYGATDLSDVVFRIPGVSVAGGQFAVVRGLSDRFLSTTLQGIKLPTPDPEKQAVQLDLIPASAVEAVVVSKTYEPSLWAESSGGNMDVRTRAIPSEGLLKVSFGLKMNSNAADGGPSYAIRGRTNERLGFGSKSRLEFGKGDPTWEYVPTHRSSFPVGNKLSAEFAHAFSFGDQQLGVLVNAFSEAGTKAKTGRKQALGAKQGRAATAAVPAAGSKPAVPASPGFPSDFEIGLPTTRFGLFDYEESESESVLSATTAVGYHFSADHEFKFTGLFVQSGIDLSQISGTGVAIDPITKLPKAIAGVSYSGVQDDYYAWFKTDEYFRERNLTVLQLSGRHNLPALGDLKLNWSAQNGTSYEKQSPFIEANYATPLNNLNNSFFVFGGSDVPLPLKALWADNQETQKAARLDVDWPVRLWGQQGSSFSAGAAFDSTNRETSGISTDYRQGSGGSTTAATPNGVFTKLVGGQGGIATPPTTAERKIRAYYAGANIAVVETLKVVAGARYEDFTLSTTGSGRWGGNLTSAGFYSINPAKGLLGVSDPNNPPPFTNQKWYPAAGLIFTPWKSLTARLHYSKTTGRPSLREVSPFFNKSIETDNLVVGNPALKPSDVTNYDVRVEWSPTKTDFFALSAFRKDIKQPIEKLIFTQTNPAVGELTESWVNNPGTALVRGLEFEFRHSLKSWSESLSDFSLSGNYTRMDAAVDEIPQVHAQLLGVYQDPAKIPKNRRLFDQPEYIANLDLTWSHTPWGTSATLAVFAISDVLVAGGKPAFFDLYERAHSRLDFLFNQQLTSRLKLKLAIKNLGDPARGLIYDREATSALAERNTYHAGRDFSGSLTYDF